ncbi:MAG: hypothetical protein QOG77_2618 [Solirubrobacteraceae bacterium]|nr:hypothetical protein [Solirubrobacteraceae bacterium]
MALVLLAGCGGSAPQPERGADFVEQADAACAGANLAALGTLTEGGGDLAANLREGKRRGDDLATDIARLEAPRELRSARAAYVVVISRLAALSGEAADAVARGDQAHVREVEGIQGPLAQRGRDLARRMGLTECSPSG